MTALEPAAESGLLVSEPLVRTEIKIGYARVSTGGQKLERQLDALTVAGCRKIFADKKSGKNALRPELKACHAFLDPGDTLVVPSLDRYGRSLQDLINMVAELRERGVGFTSLHENLDTTTPGGRLVFHVFAALAEFIRELIFTELTRAWPLPAPAAGSAGAPASPPRKSSVRPATCCPTPAAPSPRSRSYWASPRARSTTTSPTSRNSARALCPASSKPPRSRGTPARSFSPGFPVRQLLTPEVPAIAFGYMAACFEVAWMEPSRPRA